MQILLRGPETHVAAQTRGYAAVLRPYTHWWLASLLGPVALSLAAICTVALLATGPSHGVRHEVLELLAGRHDDPYQSPQGSALQPFPQWHPAPRRQSHAALPPPPLPLSGDPLLIGCSDGSREWLTDLERYPKIAACQAAWHMTSMRAKRSKVPCEPGSVCDSPADACAFGWHVCGDSHTEADELREHLTAEACTNLAPGRYLTALSDQDCGHCGKGGGHGSVCCGLRCVQQNGNCVYPNATAWAGIVKGHVDACGEAQMTPQSPDNGVLCCKP